MKSIGKFLLILLLYCVIFAVCDIVLVLIAYALLQTSLGYFLLGAFLSMLGWGDPVPFCAYIACIITAICLYNLSERLSAFPQLRIFGIVLAVVSVLFGIMNFFSPAPASAVSVNAAHAIIGIVLFVITPKNR